MKEPSEDEEALIARIRGADDPLADLLRPLPDEERSAMAARVIASLGAPGARVVPLRPRRAAEALRWALPLAAAFLAAAVWLLVPRGSALVRYQLEVSGDALTRGEPSASDAPVTLRPETRLRVVLSPEQPVRDVALRLLVVRGGRAAVISPPAMADGQGGFTLDAPAGKLLGEQADGPVELVFAVGRPLPEDEALIRLAVDPAAQAPPSVRLTRRGAVLVGFSPRHGALGWSGCEAVRAGPLCEVGAGAPLHVWAEGADPSRFEVRLDGRAAAARPVAVEGGLRFRVEGAAAARRLTLHLGGREVLGLALAEAPPSPVAAAEALRRDGKLDEAEASLNEAERAPAARLFVLRVRAKLARRRGDAARAAALREEAIAAERREGRVSDEVDDTLARVHELLYQDGALAEARRRLDALPPPAEGDGAHQVKLDYYRGLLAGELGDLRTAVESLRAARRGARRFVLPVYEASAAAPLADMLSSFGRDDEAGALLAEASLGEGADPCDRAGTVMNHGAVLLRGGHVEAADARLRDAARLAESACPRLRGDVLTNLAFARRDAGDARGARALLEEARAARPGPDAWMGAFRDRLSVELLLGDDPRAALAAAEAVRRAGQAGSSPELLFDAAFGRARALDALGDEAAALAYAAAEEALDAWSALVPLGEGRQAFLDRQERAPRAFLDFHLRRAARPGAPPAAAAALAAAARRSVARFSRVLGELGRAGALAQDDGYAAALAAYRVARVRIDASLAGGRDPAQADLAAVRAPQDAAARAPAPPPLGEGELLLVYHPLPEGWLGVASTASTVLAVPLGRLDPGAPPAALAAALLAPFRALLHRAASVRLQAHRALAGVAFHALPWEGGALIDALPVAYGLDLPASPAPACAGPAVALVVADAREDLAGAGAAATTVAEALRARGFTVRLLRGEAARREAVLGALADPCVRRFHYEGHAVFAGRDGVEAALLLADGRVTAAEILRLPGAPPTVVLSGCSTGEAEGLGLAQAFLARGSAEVLATTRPVADATAARVARRLHPPAGPPSLAAAWRAALAGLREDGVAGGDLDAYRVLHR